MRARAQNSRLMTKPWPCSSAACPFSSYAVDADLLPRRVRNHGDWAQVCHIKRSWILSGQVKAESDFYPWLRSCQLQGSELCVLGASLSACQVCVEAWHSGFKPVLVLLVDKLGEGASRDIVLRAAYKLQRRYGVAGLLYTGFRVLLTRSADVSLWLDASGQPVDVTVHVASECNCMQTGEGRHKDKDRDKHSVHLWLDSGGQPVDLSVGKDRDKPASCSGSYNFKGPAIALQGVVTQDMVKHVDSECLASFHERVVHETREVTNPQFWEDRHDPECLPVVTSTFQSYLPACLLSVVLVAGELSVYRARAEPMFGLLRLAVSFACLGPGIIGAAFAHTRLTGLTVLSSWPTLYAFCICGLSLLPVIPGVLLRFHGQRIASYLVIVWLAGQTANLVSWVYVRCVVRLRSSLWSHLWYLATLQGTTGAWLIVLPILLAYLGLLGKDSTVACIFLSVTLSSVEALQVWGMSHSYACLVMAKRRGDPECVPGDQKWSLSLTYCVIHSSVENARLAILVCGAISATEFSFVRGVAISLAITTVFNILKRTGLLGKLLLQLQLRLQVGPYVSPSSSWSAHNNVRFTMGWGRFAGVLGLMLGRGLIHGRWEVSWIAPEGVHDTWCWSGLVLVTVGIALLAEFLEDVMVFRLVWYWAPLSRSQAFRELSVRRLQDPQQRQRQHVCHYALPEGQWHWAVGKGNREGQGQGQGDAEDEVRTWGDMVLSPNLTNVRLFDSMMLVSLITGGNALMVSVISVGVGSGNLLGICRPLDPHGDSFHLFLRNMLLWDLSCDL